MLIVDATKESTEPPGDDVDTGHREHELVVGLAMRTFTTPPDEGYEQPYSWRKSFLSNSGV